MIITRKIEIEVFGNEEEKKNAWGLLREYYNKTPRVYNFIVTEFFLNDLLTEKVNLHNDNIEKQLLETEDKISKIFEEIKINNENIKKCESEKEKTGLDKKKKKLDEELLKFKEEKNKLIREAKKEVRDKFLEGFGKQLDSSTRERVKAVPEFDNLHSDIIDLAINGLGFYKKSLYKIRTGEERIRFYSKGMPIDTRGRTLQFFEEENKIYIKWIKKIVFKCRFGEDRSNNREIVNRLILGEYKASDSKIQIKRNRIFLLLSVNLPEKIHVLDENKILGVDLGIKYPAYIATNTGFFRESIGHMDDFFKTRTMLQNRKQRLQKALSLASGGKGRTKKLKALDQYAEKERNFVKTYNHQVSARIVQQAVNERCKTINLEFLKGFSKEHKESRILRNWSYYELQQMIEYKAKMNGINVAYIDPYHTSQTCSECGNHEDGQRLTQEKFVCKNCNFEANADYNASRNIAKSTKYISDEKQTEYYKLRKNRDV